jgi:hypothetical protein
MRRLVIFVMQELPRGTFRLERRETFRCVDHYSPHEEGSGSCYENQSLAQNIRVPGDMMFDDA